MKALHIQGIGGASGDMILAALLDLGVSADAVTQALHSLPIEPVRLVPSPAGSHGLHGLRLDAQCEVHEHSAQPAPHSHPHKHPSPPPAPHVPHPPEHAHRSFRDIRHILNHGSLSPTVLELSLKVFTRLAEAEGRVHGVPAEEVTFHEVGAVDSIADVVGACFALDALEVRQVSFDPLPLGAGLIECAHGLYPVPAPAVLELLRGLPTAGSCETGEMVTPTGAALLTAWRTHDTCPPGRILRIGFGFGRRSWPSRPNALRATWIEAGDPETEQDTVLCLETHLDDVSPEVLGALVDLLMEAGAWDVALTPILMKKQRPGVRLTVLCDPALRDPLRLLIFKETGTFGIRETLTQRARLSRRTETVKTPFGPVRMKIGLWQGEVLARKPELEDCRLLAAQAGVPIRDVMSAARRAAGG